LIENNKRRVLNVGGNNKGIAIPRYFDAFDHLIADIDQSVEPDILIDARALNTQQSQQFDAIYCSHNLEHFFTHDVSKVLSGFRHVLKADGFAEIRVPDLVALMHHIVENKLDLDDMLYETSAGYPITALDVFYGWRREIERSGEEFYAHKTGFSQKTLQKVLNEAGFNFVVFRPGRLFEIYALAFFAKPNAYYQELLSLNIGD